MHSRFGLGTALLVCSLATAVRAAERSVDPVSPAQPAPVRSHGIHVALQPTYHGLTGYFTAYPQESSDIRQDGWGLSMYSAIQPVKPGKDDWTQLGWGTWMLPNPYENASGVWDPVPKNPDDSTVNFCPQIPGAINFQSIEGGVGSWGNVKYPVASTLYAITATANCYGSSVGGAAYVPGAERTLDPNEVYFAQLSNRFLVPPGAVVFENPTVPSILGYGWIALPIVSANASPDGIPTGPNSWTLFVNSANFKGAVGFFTPAMWTAINEGQSPPLSVGYGLDSRNAVAGQAAMEVGFTNSFDAASGTDQYRRVPRLRFLVDGNNRAVLEQDFTRYYKTAIWDAWSAWVNGGAAPAQFGPTGIWHSEMKTPDQRLRMLDDSNPIALGTTVNTVCFTTPEGTSVFGLQWDGSSEVGVLPEYYEKIDGIWTPIVASRVPDSTELKYQHFPELPMLETPPVDTSESSPWKPGGWAAGPFTTVLSNGSEVTYVWYRFVDQPAIARLPLSDGERAKLQAWAGRVHDQGTNGLTIPPPTSGHLVSLDPGQIVTPPPGLERGYVPIAIGQKRRPG
jgi:hypothetical protein